MFLFATHLPNQIQKTSTRFDVPLRRKISQYFILCCPPSINRNRTSYNACLCLSLRDRNLSLWKWNFMNGVFLSCPQKRRKDMVAVSWLFSRCSKSGIRILNRMFPLSAQKDRQQLYVCCLPGFVQNVWYSTLSGLFLLSSQRCAGPIHVLCFLALFKTSESQLKTDSFSYLLKMLTKAFMFAASWLCSERSKLHIRLWMSSFPRLLRKAGNPAMFAASWLCSKCSK